METAPIKIYTSIEKLPFSKFVDCHCDGDLSALVISGTPTEDDLQSAWEDILQQYHDAIGGTQHATTINLYSELYREQIKLQQVNIAVSVLEKYYVKEIATALNKLLRSSFKFDYTKPEEYKKDLQGCLTRSNSFSIQIKLLSIRIQATSKSDLKEDSKPTRAYYQGLLITLSDHAGRELDENTMTVFVFCERLKRYIKFVEQSKRQTQNQR